MIAPKAIRAALAARGLYWLFIEGGGVTDLELPARRLPRPAADHGRAGHPRLGPAEHHLPAIGEPRHGLRPPIRRLSLGADTLFECIFGLS